ncbi:hypothetical protein [Rhodococcus wratislaviensis]|uniref:hypothetical protein n=1 Tax=Rhodococcus wratislaviensis TaxID=44752 RepID=UPI000F57F18A|nr:hypothetical protein [Rhodococcus wratislaviensis]
MAGLVDDAADSIRLAQLPALSGRLLDIESETRIDETTQVKRRAEVEYEMGIEADRIRLLFGGQIVSITASAAVEVNHLLEAEKNAQRTSCPASSTNPGVSCSSGASSAKGYSPYVGHPTPRTTRLRRHSGTRTADHPAARSPVRRREGGAVPARRRADLRPL